MSMNPSRRHFLRASLAAGLCPVALAGKSLTAEASFLPLSRHSPIPDLADRIGTTLVAGKYQLTQEPALIEGAKRMLAMGTRVGKFWFEPSRERSDYPFHSKWPGIGSLVDLARTSYWNEVFQMPFSTLMLIAHGKSEAGWKDKNAGDTGFYQGITSAFEALTRQLYQDHGGRDLTIILQNWEGDWQIRGTGETWETPPENWKTLCDRFARRLAARQLGVTRARAAAPPGSKLRVLHAAEVNRVTDQWKGIPTMTEQVLPQIEMDLVSYSCYDAMKDGATLYKAIETVRHFAKTTGPHGPGAVYVGEIGIPENVAKERIAARWDDLLGAAFSARALYIVQWQLYCNELNPKFAPHPKIPIHEEWRLRGFWLIKPDGSLTETGKVFSSLWAAD